MSTRSFMKNVTIKDKTVVNDFINALENAEGKNRKRVEIDAETVKDKDKIKKIFDR